LPEHYESARTRLLIVVPLAVVLVFTLLFLTYRNVIDSLRVFTGVPLGWVGGVFALYQSVLQKHEPAIRETQ
jgi:heavy metal efflux system protein